MAQPELRLSIADKELLRLLAELLSHQAAVPRGNYPENAAVLSDSDANRLLTLIDTLVNSRDFFERSHFLQALTAPGGPDSSAREIYLSLRKERGRSRALSSFHWSDYQVRLGISANRYPYSAALPMSDELFLKREKQLLIAGGVSAEVADLAIKILGKYLPEQNRGWRQLPVTKANDIREAVSEPFSRASLQSGEVSTRKLVATMSLVADMGVLFTTRDWNVVGTISSVAGCTIAMLKD
jgi:hypothetical protein